MNHPIQYIFLNKGLHMSTGKAAAQATHASIMGVLASNEKRRKVWADANERTVIILEARDVEHLASINVYLTQRGVTTRPIIDEGVNEIDPHTLTALASTILNKDDEDEVEPFKTFNLYRDTVKINLEFER